LNECLTYETHKIYHDIIQWTSVFTCFCIGMGQVKSQLHSRQSTHRSNELVDSQACFTSPSSQVASLKFTNLQDEVKGKTFSLVHVHQKTFSSLRKAKSWTYTRSKVTGFTDDRVKGLVMKIFMPKFTNLLAQGLYYLIIIRGHLKEVGKKICMILLQLTHLFWFKVIWIGSTVTCLTSILN
jgi:hypothetical protein